MDVSGGLAAPTAVLGALGGEVCQPKAGVQIYDEVTDSVIEAFIMMLMVGAVEEVVTIKEGVECRETCWGIPKGHGALTAHGGANVSWSRSGVGFPQTAFPFLHLHQQITHTGPTSLPNARCCSGSNSAPFSQESS